MKAEKIVSYKPSINSFEVSRSPLLPSPLVLWQVFKLKHLRFPPFPDPPDDEGWQGRGLAPRPERVKVLLRKCLLTKNFVYQGVAGAGLDQVEST